MITVLFLASVALILWCAESRNRLNLLVCFGAAALMSAVQMYRSRAFLAYDHPFYAGQRYFYLPYLFVCWTLIVSCQNDKKWIRLLAT